jgi:sugar lactone lactonase YvrE
MHTCKRSLPGHRQIKKTCNRPVNADCNHVEGFYFSRLFSFYSHENFRKDFSKTQLKHQVMKLKSLKDAASIMLLFLITGMYACKKDTNSNTGAHSAVRIDSFAPDTATVDDLVVIQGANFGGRPEDNTVVVQNTTLVAIAVTANSLTVKIPARSTSGKITVTVNGQSTESAQNFVYEPSVRTLSGDGTLGFKNGQGNVSQFRLPGGIATDVDGNLYVADRNNNMIRKITLQGVTTTVAGDGTPGLVNGNAAQARFNQPTDVVVDEVGNIFIADAGNNCIRQITPDGFVSTHAGNGVAGFKDGPGAQAMFNFPSGITLDSNENVYVTDNQNSRIRKVTAGGIVSTFAGTGEVGFKDGAAKTEAKFNFPLSLDIDGQGNIFVADAGNFRIRKIGTDGTVSTFAGTGVDGTKDGDKSVAQFGIVSGLKLDQWGNIHVADASYNLLRKISANGSVTTIAGQAGEGFAEGRADKARFNLPFDVAIDHFGNVFVSDRENQRIRIVQ